MTSDPTRTDPRTTAQAQTQAQAVRDALEQEIGPVGRAIAAIVRSLSRGLDQDRLALRVTEVLNETACRALEHPGSYQPDRPVVPWLVGIARNILRSEARDAATRPRRTELDEADWERLLGVLDPPDGSAADCLDVEAMLTRLAPTARKALECRYWQGLEGDVLAKALGASSAGAARLRVYRALQDLKHLFLGEVAR